MASQQIEIFLNDALKNFSKWLNENSWIGKEHDCVNLFAHKILFDEIAKGAKNAIIHHPTQICIECGLKQPKDGNYNKRFARKDLVLWEYPYQNSWSVTWEAVNIPIAVMEWKVKFKANSPSKISKSHDDDWIRRYTEENPSCIGYVVFVDITSKPWKKVEWRLYKQGVFS